MVKAVPGSDLERLETALRWLKSHHKRLQVDRRSLERQLAALSAEIERLEGEIARAEARRRELAPRA